MSTCWHCGEALPANPPLATVAGVSHAVCCNGCRAAAEWIDKLGLADYYRLRSSPSARAPDPQAAQRNAQTWQRPELARHVVRTLDAKHSEALLLIDGIRCAACVWLIERSLSAVAGITSVQVNAAAQRARIVWDPARTDLPTILAALAQTGYSALPLDAAALDDARRREARAALKRLAVAGFGAMQAMMYASAIYLGAWGAMDPATREAMRWLGLLVATPVVFYSAAPFFAGAVRALRARTLGMDVPVALAIALIYAASVIEAMRGGGEVYFDSVSMFVFFLLVGRYLEMRARHRAGNLADAMARLVPAFADRIQTDGAIERIGALELVPDDHVQIAQGERVPADAVLESAASRVDESLLTGESAPVRKSRGDGLIGGSLVLEGPVIARVTRVGADTALAGIAALVARAQSERPRLARAGERAAAGFVARVLALAALCAIGWSLVDPARALTATLAVLVVSCPCAFALAVPAALTRALSVLASRGVFVVHTDAIENLALATHAVFDKTGTLTCAELDLTSIDALDPDEALALAAALARGSTHPAAQALSRAAAGIAPREARDVRTVAGGGIQGTIDGRHFKLGQRSFALSDNSDGADADSVILAEGVHVIAAFALRERLRANARETLDALRADGVSVELASGDAQTKVEAIAQRLGIESWRARMSPADKLERLHELRARGARVIAIGDGINDAPVLAGADVAVALASGTELAQAAGDIVLDGNNLPMLAQARAIARETLAVLRQNQRWALVYNLSVVPLGALGFVPPWLAAIGMSMSSLVVILNALRIGRTPAQTQPIVPTLAHTTS
ncbi:MAG: cadmium-translocating P-type ATPase [Xanthomonadales bacterium PRO7]|nr:cadmium-translocating P-type ATPase [Xanthomonadales bacterium PRO7]HMM57172.1 heavy metal translocating P-type ATPase [Rudaea sp.]